ncbi:MAG: nicotinamide-nucleotide amidohydrolase family protein [Planctomycetales bacterium]
MEKLRRRQLRLALAESCTGGLVAARLTSIAGASDILCGSMVSYRDLTKREWLGISATELEKFSSVSREITHAMAIAVLAETPEASLAAAVTGHLGPDAPPELDGALFVTVVFRDPDSNGDRTLIEDEYRLEASPRVARQAEAADFVLRQIEKSLDTATLS